ncbi:MAG: AI-2E family transporter [Actinobacteria bacterium]|nr:AI-2E family transporter [Actinomycetota bacterium]
MTDVSPISPAPHPLGDGPPPWLKRAGWELLGVLVAAYALYEVSRQLRGFFIQIAIAVFIAIALDPGVTILEKRGWRRGVATGALFGLIVLGSTLFVALMIPLIVDQAGTLVDLAPTYVDQIGTFAERFGFDAASGTTAALDALRSNVTSLAGGIAGSLVGLSGKLVNTLFQTLTIGLFAFYLTADAPRVRRALLSLLPPRHQAEVLRGLEIAIDKTGAYFYSRALLALVGAGIAWAVFAALGIPFSLALALWFGVLSQFIPVVGTYIGGILPLLIGLLESPSAALGVLVFMIVYQMIENYLLAPKITAHTMELHPAVAFGSAIVGASLMGAIGAFIALPAAATTQAFVAAFLDRHELIESDLLGGDANDSAEPEDV